MPGLHSQLTQCRLEHIPSAPASPSQPCAPPPTPTPATADVTRVQTSPGATSGNSKLTISLRTMPKSLRNTSQQFMG